VGTDFIDDEVLVGDATGGSVQAREQLKHGFIVTAHEGHEYLAPHRTQGAVGDP
jgi:hypothetical protein